MAISWTDFSNGDSLLTIRNSLNTFNTNVVSAVNANTTNVSTNTTNIATNTADIASNISRLGILESRDVAYGGYSVEPNLQLTNIYQKVTGFIPMITPKNVSEVNGVLTVNKSGIYTGTVERLYINNDTNPSQPVVLYIDIRKNGVSILTRSAIIGAATAGDEPAGSTYTSPLILELTSGDYFEVYVKAEEGLNSPSSTYLTRVQYALHTVN